MRRILLIRHGESLGNVDPLAYGRVGDPHLGLTETGWRQVFKTGDFLQSFYRDNPCEGRAYPQAVDTSDWIRAVQTEEAATRHFQGNPDIIFSRSNALREQSFGTLYRQHFTRRSTSLKTTLREAARAYQKNPFEAVPPQGESPSMHYDRVLPVAWAMLQDQDISDRVVIAHGSTNRHIMTLALGLPPGAWKQIENQNNGDVTLLEDRGQGFTVRKIYDGLSGQRVDHNPVKTSSSSTPAP